MLPISCSNLFKYISHLAPDNHAISLKTHCPIHEIIAIYVYTSKQFCGILPANKLKTLITVIFNDIKERQKK